MSRTRGFEKIKKYQNVNFNMPERKTKLSAGYDLYAPEEITIPPDTTVLVPTGLKAYMPDNEWLGLHIRSSYAVKKNLSLVNNVGVVDADYYNNSDNEGHIMVPLHNKNTTPFTIPFNEPFAQAIFGEYKTTDDDNAQNTRTGGFGSTSQ